MERPYHLVLFGATGFTGSLVARYVASHAEAEGLGWAIAGRHPDRLEAIRADLPANKPDVIIADVTDADSLDAMAAQTSVLMNAVGPFNRYGRGVVEACIRHSTHYLDITGEPSFVATVYNELGEAARSARTCVVNCCGFDSIPADYAAWLTARQLPQATPKILRTYVRTNARFSGGTLNTAIQALHMESRGTSTKVRLPKHPDAPPVRRRIHYSEAMKAWAIPMPVVDPHIVKRSAYHMPEAYGPAVTYAQFFVRSSLLKVMATVLPVGAALLLARFAWFRNWMARRYPPGWGPDEQTRAASRFEVVCFGEGGGQHAQTRLAGGDPGYNETAAMFAQSAFTVLQGAREGTLPFGVLTPVQAFGQTLVERVDFLRAHQGE
jgi:short subunit dehydrogenase-like uncharacterized protein